MALKPPRHTTISGHPYSRQWWVAPRSVMPHHHQWSSVQQTAVGSTSIGHAVHIPVELVLGYSVDVFTRYFEHVDELLQTEVYYGVVLSHALLMIFGWVMPLVFGGVISGLPLYHGRMCYCRRELRLDTRKGVCCESYPPTLMCQLQQALQNLPAAVTPGFIAGHFWAVGTVGSGVITLPFRAGEESLMFAVQSVLVSMGLTHVHHDYSRNGRTSYLEIRGVASLTAFVRMLQSYPVVFMAKYVQLAKLASIDIGIRLTTKSFAA